MDVLLLMLMVAAVLVALVAWLGKAGKPKPPTVLICGATGVGKSTLVNVLLGRAASSVGTGQPVTQNTARVYAEGDAFAFYDSRGLEVEEASQTYLVLLSDLLRLRFERSPRLQVDLVLMCIAEPSARIDDAHEEIAHLCEDLHIPLGVLLTKAQGDEDFRAVVTTAFPMACFVQQVRALPLKLPKVELPAEGVDEVQALLRQYARADMAEARARAAQAPGARQMAQAAAHAVGSNADAAWTSLAGAAFQLLLGRPAQDWTKWLGEARSGVQRALVPGFFRRLLVTKFDNDSIDGELARRAFPRILRAFGHRDLQLAMGSRDHVVNEALQQLQQRRPFRSRL